MPRRSVPPSNHVTPQDSPWGNVIFQLFFLLWCSGRARDPPIHSRRPGNPEIGSKYGRRPSPLTQPRASANSSQFDRVQSLVVGCGDGSVRIWSFVEQTRKWEVASRVAWSPGGLPLPQTLQCSNLGRLEHRHRVAVHHLFCLTPKSIQPW